MSQANLTRKLFYQIKSLKIVFRNAVNEIYASATSAWLELEGRENQVSSIPTALSEIYVCILLKELGKLG